MANTQGGGVSKFVSLLIADIVFMEGLFLKDTGIRGYLFPFVPRPAPAVPV
jgi:hypothetical protein